MSVFLNFSFNLYFIQIISLLVIRKNGRLVNENHILHSFFLFYHTLFTDNIPFFILFAIQSSTTWFKNLLLSSSSLILFLNLCIRSLIRSSLSICCSSKPFLTYMKYVSKSAYPFVGLIVGSVFFLKFLFRKS